MSDENSDASDEQAVAEWLDSTLFSAASALIVERYIPGSQRSGDSGEIAQLIGPFRKDMTEVMEFIERRKAHDARERSGESPVVDYRIRLFSLREGVESPMLEAP